MEIPRLGVKLELQLPAYATATAMSGLSHTCNLHHSSRQCQIPDPLSEARDQTCILMDASQVHFHCTTMGTPKKLTFNLSMEQFQNLTTYSPLKQILSSKNWYHTGITFQQKCIIGNYTKYTIVKKLKNKEKIWYWKLSIVLFKKLFIYFVF